MLYNLDIQYFSKILCLTTLHFKSCFCFRATMATSDSKVTVEDCQKILQNYAKNNTVTYKSHKIHELSSIEGLIGKHYKLKIIYESSDKENEVDLFLKVLNTENKVMQYMISSILAYEKEDFYYNDVLNQCNVNNIATPFASECYYCRPSLLVLEDLSLRGFRNRPRKDLLDVKHCKIALGCLAKFHAANVALEKIKSDSDTGFVSLLKQHPQLLEDTLFAETKNAATEWFECTLRGLMTLIDLLPKADVSAEEYTAKLVEVLQSPQDPDSMAKYKSTVLHGDLWSNNFMFQYKNNVPVSSILIDYQTIKYGPIALDVTQMILTNVRLNVRAVHYEELLSFYYHQFVDACEENGIQALDFISYKDFLQCCEEVKIISKIASVADHSTTLLIGDDIREILMSDETLRKFLLEDRSESMLQSFKENEMYCEIMTEDLTELRNLLFSA